MANNVFKVAILGKHAKKDVLLKFGSTAVFAAFVGAWVVGLLTESNQSFEYSLFGHAMVTTLLNIIVGGLILIFVLLESSKSFAAIKLGPRFLPLVGSISGFFGGLSGHQGAFRSMFLLKAGLSKEQFIATGVMVAVMVDVTRLMVYSQDLAADYQSIDWQLVIAASVSAFVGAYLGKRLLQKITIKFVHWVVSTLLVVVALGLMTGVI